MQTTSSSPAGERDVDLLSAYEDALDISESELQRLCEDAARHLKRDRPRPQGILLTPIMRPSSSKHKRSSSSENSSIEKVDGNQIRSRLPTGSRTRRSANRSGSSQSDEDWRAVNFAFQEVSHYPVLVQINQQLQLLSRQLYEIESTNALQLRIIAQLLGKLVKTRRTSFFSLSRIFKVLRLVLCGIFWHFLSTTVFRYILRNRSSIRMLRYF